jgi:hypothetical protein
LIELVRIPAENVETVWPLVSDYITRACQLGEYKPEQLREWCIGETAELWVAWSGQCEAAMITTAPDEETCLIAVLGGRNMDNWLGLIGEIEQWARARGAKVMRLYGRKGWARKLPDYRITRYIMDKAL